MQCMSSIQILEERKKKNGIEKNDDSTPLLPPPIFLYSTFAIPLSQNKRNGRSSARKTEARKFVQDRVYLRSLIKTIPCLYAEALNSEGMTVFSASNCPSRANLPVMAGQRKKKKKKKEFSSTVNLALAIKMLKEQKRTGGEGEEEKGRWKETLERRLGRNTKIIRRQNLRG